MDHRTAETLLQRAVAGVDVAERELDAAFAHVEGCAVCSARFELGRAEASSEGEDMAEVPVEPTALYARALTAALSGSEAVARRRAAERLGTLADVPPPALAALVRSAAQDRDESVRAAALAALDALDDAVSLSERVVAAWSAAPEEAEPYLADILQRLADEDALASPRVTRLVAEEAAESAYELVVRGEHGVAGRVARDEERLWLRLDSVPGEFERTLPVVAVPAAAQSSAIEWSGPSPGLARAREPVSEGSLEVYLGNLLPREALSSKLFERLYLLDPRKRRV